ncbi:hypothetical protein MRB53_041322 [Persea americana]|nr:hypothetical protein MRB53_041322 [Persea americana]
MLASSFFSTPETSLEPAPRALLVCRPKCCVLPPCPNHHLTGSEDRLADDSRVGYSLPDGGSYMLTLFPDASATRVSRNVLVRSHLSAGLLLLSSAQWQSEILIRAL